MTTFESDPGGQGGPWNLSKKLRFLDLLMFRGRVGVFDPLNLVWGVCNLARSFGNSILIIFLFLKISNGPPEPKLGHFEGNRLRFVKILNFIKKIENRLLTHWVERPLEAFGSMIFLTTLLFSFSLFLFVCLFVGFFCRKKGMPKRGTFRCW